MTKEKRVKIEILGNCVRCRFPSGSDSKESTYNVGDLGSIPGLGRSPGEANGYPLLPGELYGQRSLAGYSPWDRKESNMTERLIPLPYEIR